MMRWPWFSGTRRQREISEEIQSHLRMAIQDRIDRGEAPGHARTSALREFGNAGLVKEDTRSVWVWTALERLGQDLKYALRQMRRSPGFTAVAVLSLALGIGANTAIFSLMDALFLKMLPVRNPEELVWVANSVSFPAYKKLRDRNQLFSGMAAASFIHAGARMSGEVERVSGQMVTGNYYSVLGVDAFLGRVLSPQDDQIPGVGGPEGPVAVISYAYWKRRFALDPSVVGKTITLNGVPVTIVGVTPPRFFGVNVGSSMDITVPIMLQPQVMPSASTELWANGQRGSELEYDESDRYGWRPMIARLKPGVTVAQAHAELNALYQRILAERAGSSVEERQQRENRARKLELAPAGNGLFREGFDLIPGVGRPTALHMLAVLAAPGLVLLIACANVANLLLARATARQQEVAVRLAIGAGRPRLLRQFLTESMLLTLMGGALGVALAGWGRDLLLALIRPWDSPLYLRAETDGRVLTFAVAATLVATILFGLAPAFHATKANLANMLKDGAGNRGGGQRRLELGKVLVVAQVALSLPLLVVALLLARSLQNKINFDLGFNRENLLLFSTEFLGSNVSRTGPLLKEVQERMAGLPGARAVGMSQVPPPLAPNWMKVSVEGIAPLPEEEMFTRRLLVSPGFFEAVGIPLLAGRELSTRDSENAPKVCVVNAAMADKFFPNSNPVGRRFIFPRLGADYEVEIVGVVENVRGYWLPDKRLALAYCPMLQYLPVNTLTLEVRVAGAPAAVISEVRRRFQDIDRNLLVDVKTWDAFQDGMEFESIWLSRLSSVLSLLALLLACIGLYGVMAYSVARRTNEIGIRMALGADRRNVAWMVLRETLGLVVIGVALGLATSHGFTRIMASMLFGVKTTDMATISLATALLLAVALVAGYLPARRASRLDPSGALRHE